MGFSRPATSRLRNGGAALDLLRSPNSRRRAPSSGLIARDQIARVKQAALECREVEHQLKVGAPMQKSISGVFLPRQRAFAERWLA